MWTDKQTGIQAHIHADRTTTRSTQPCISPGSLNRVPASAAVRAEMSPLHSPLPRICFRFLISKWGIVVHSWCNFFVVQLVALHVKSSAFDTVSVASALILCIFSPPESFTRWITYTQAKTLRGEKILSPRYIFIGGQSPPSPPPPGSTSLNWLELEFKK